MSTKAVLKDILLRELTKKFFLGDLNFTLELDVENMDWNWQQTLLNATLNSNIIKMYPISSHFICLFIKKIIQYLEPNQEVHDDFYSQLCTAMNASDKDGYSYRHYIIGNDINNIVTIKETRNMVVNGTTGLKTWEAALMLTDWALCHKETFSNKNILELGSGVGFAGITIAKMCDVKSLMLTDCHNDVLKTICENIEINFSHLQRKDTDNVRMYKDDRTSLSVLMLDWNAKEDLSNIPVPDILIGADIVYDPSILKPLCNVLKTFCDKNKTLEVYIASVIRNEETFKRFLKTLGGMKLNYEEVELSKSTYIEWDERIHKCLLKIKITV